MPFQNLDNGALQATSIEWTRSTNRKPTAFLKGGEACLMNTADIREAVDAVDDWIRRNQQSFGNFLPDTFTRRATFRQKMSLLSAVTAAWANRAEGEGR